MDVIQLRRQWAGRPSDRRPDRVSKTPFSYRDGLGATWPAGEGLLLEHDNFRTGLVLVRVPHSLRSHRLMVASSVFETAFLPSPLWLFPAWSLSRWTLPEAM